MVEALCASYQVSTRQACEACLLPRASFYYQSVAKSQAYLRRRIQEIAMTRVRYGYRRIHTLLRREGWPINMKRVYRLYRSMELQMRNKRPKRRVSAQIRESTSSGRGPNEQWSMDLVSDELFDGRRIRSLTIVDNFTRESLMIYTAFSCKGVDVANVLEEVVQEYGAPKSINVDNGPEFISKELDLWAYKHSVTLNFSRPGKPTDNAFIESFNGRFREECLNQHWFLSL
jgi:putative transposase